MCQRSRPSCMDGQRRSRCNTSYPCRSPWPGVSLMAMNVDRGHRRGRSAASAGPADAALPGLLRTAAPVVHASTRTVRDLDGTQVTARPDRARCTRWCHPRAAGRRAAAPAWLHGACGGHELVRATHREIAGHLDAPRGTVRGWIRHARRSAHQLWTLGVAAVVTLDQDALPTRERSDPLAARSGCLGSRGVRRAARARPRVR
jgi:hypothetical protein